MCARYDATRIARYIIWRHMAARLAEVLRDIARGGYAGAIAGLVIGGLGGRVVMRIAAAINPDATGMRTDNGELIGAITVNGTLALLVFGGLLNGLLAAVLWAIASPWIAWSGWRRLAAGAICALAFGAPLLLLTTTPDFVTLDQDALIVTLLLIVVAALGATLAAIDRWLDGHMPLPGRMRAASSVLYLLTVLAGMPVLQIGLGFYLTASGCECADPPRALGWALVVLGLLTLAWWVIRVARGLPPPPQLVIAARATLVVATVLGFVRLAVELGDIARLPG
jgi:hypothetical protein